MQLKWINSTMGVAQWTMLAEHIQGSWLDPRNTHTHTQRERERERENNLKRHFSKTDMQIKKHILSMFNITNR
jgi:ABC-type uncharacterized transport system fused permease/ATPase subunit